MTTIHKIHRRDFLRLIGLGAGGLLIPPLQPKAAVYWDERVVRRLNVAANVLALTIDDGYTTHQIQQSAIKAYFQGFDCTWFMTQRGLEALADNETNFIWSQNENSTLGYHSRFHRWEDVIVWSRQDWKDDYDAWLEVARRSLGDDLDKRLMPWLRPPFGWFSDACLEMCDDYALTPYGWSLDPYEWKRGQMPRAGDIVLLHARSQDWSWFEQLAEDWCGEVTDLRRLERYSDLFTAHYLCLPNRPY